MFKFIILSFVIVFAGLAQANHPKGSAAPQVSMPGMPAEIVAGAICHYYTDYGLFIKKLSEINKVKDKIIRTNKIKDLLYLTYADCVVKMHDEINDYKNSF
jgi:hypothetical protein